MENSGLARALAVIVVVWGVIASLAGLCMAFVGAVDGRERHLVGWGLLVVGGGAAVGSFGFLCLAVYGLATRAENQRKGSTPAEAPGKITPAPIAQPVASVVIEMEPELPAGSVPHENPESETRDQQVARRLAEYEARKKQ